MSNKKLSFVKSVYLPEHADVQKVAVAETARKKETVTVGAIIRQAVREFVERYWKKHGS